MQKFISISYDEVRDAIKNNINYDHNSFDYIIAVARGGLVPATIISHKLKIPLLVVTVKSYVDDSVVQNLEFKILQEFDKSLIEGMKVLLVDDISDTGLTLDMLHERYSPLVRSIHAAVICSKRPPKNVTCDHCISVNEDEWVIFPWENVSFSIPQAL